MSLSRSTTVGVETLSCVAHHSAQPFRFHVVRQRGYLISQPVQLHLLSTASMYQSLSKLDTAADVFGNKHNCGCGDFVMCGSS